MDVADLNGKWRENMEVKNHQIVITGNELNAAIQGYFGSEHLRLSVDEIVKNDDKGIVFLAGDKIEVVLNVYVSQGFSE